MNNPEESSDDSFHSASDGEQDNQSNSQNSNSQLTSKDNSSEEFVKLSKFPSENVVRSPKKMELNKETKKVIIDKDESDDDWFKTQMDEFGKKDSSIDKDVIRKDSQSDELKNFDNKTGSLWDWTGIHDVVSAVGNLIYSFYLEK